MRWKLFIEFCFTILVLFVVAGDILLPQPYRSSSQKLKTNINNLIVWVFPQKENLELDSTIDSNYQ